MLYISSDHGGFRLKEDLKKYLARQKIKFIDVGPKTEKQDDDYPEYTEKLVRKVMQDLEKNKGVLLCRSGHGVCIAANKFKGIRAALCWNEEVAKASRHDDDANVLCLPSNYISPEAAEDILGVWLSTAFSFEKRHQRRLKEVKRFEK